MDRVAVYAGTRNIYHDMVTSAKSLLYHNGADRVIFLTEDDTFPEQLPPCITTMNVSNQTFFKPDGPNFRSRWTYMVMMRVALPFLLPDIDRVLALDHDTIVHKPIDFIWNIDMPADSYYYFAAVEETQIQGRNHPYYNFGVALHNLAKLRDGTAQQIISSLNEYYYTYCEQDAVNSFCRRHFFSLPPEYNAMRFLKPQVPDDRVAIRHYAAENKFLRSKDDYKFYEHLSWEQVLNNASVTSSLHALTTRHDIINHFISSRSFHSFLEIGTDTGISLHAVRADRILSVDPSPSTPATHHMTSDQFFAEHTDTFDIIFIDGLHECHQAYRDIHYAIRDHLNPNGVIVIHDCLPTTEHMQEHHTSSQNYEWTGDVWKAFVRSRTELPYEMYTIDTDYGCGIIDTSIQKQSDTSSLPTDMDTMTYHDFTTNKHSWMNIKGGILHAE